MGLEAKDGVLLHRVSGSPFNLHWCFGNIL
jgi:hypothetical protein